MKIDREHPEPTQEIYPFNARLIARLRRPDFIKLLGRIAGYTMAFCVVVIILVAVLHFFNVEVPEIAALAMLVTVGCVAYALLIQWPYPLTPYDIGELKMNDRFIHTPYGSFLLFQVDYVYISITSYKGEEYNNDSAPGDGDTYMIIRHNSREIRCNFILEHDWHRIRLRRYMHQMNKQLGYQLFFTKKPKGYRKRVEVIYMNELEKHEIGTE